MINSLACWILSFVKLKNIYVWLYVLPACMPLRLVCLVPIEAKTGHCIPWIEGYR